MGERASTSGVDLVVLDREVADRVRSLPRADQLTWTEHPDFESWQETLADRPRGERVRVVVAVRVADETLEARVRALPVDDRRLDVVVAAQVLPEGAEHRLVLAGACRVITAPLPPVVVDALFRDQTFLDCLFPGELEGERFEEHELLIPTRRELVTATIRHLCGRFDALGYASDMVRSTLPLVIDEAITNAMAHGNRWEESRHVYVRARLRPGGFELLVSDEGDGFDRGHVRDPLAAENRGREGGRGLFLMERLVDEVVYEDDGSTIILRMGDATRLRGHARERGERSPAAAPSAS